MKTVGIIAEYDPFHSGHAWHLGTARRISEADYVIVVMSPDFLQRGEPALIDRWARARMALEAGADLVLELPVRCACGSAEYFASGAVHLLNSLGCVDALSFGCESPDSFDIMKKAALFFAGDEPEGYRAMLRDSLRAGVTYPKARAAAFAGYADIQDADNLMTVLSRPNNILAIEYMKALIRQGSPIRPLPVQRLGDYHDTYSSAAPDHTHAYAMPADCGCFTSGPSSKSNNGFASASAIRSKLLEDNMSLSQNVRALLPESSARILDQELKSGHYVTACDLDLLLHFTLYEKKDCLEDYLDIDKDLANRIRGCLNLYTGFRQFAAQVQSKQYTLARIRRSLIHILLGIRKEEKPAGCARVLGFRRRARPLLHRIHESSAIPLSTDVPFSDISAEDLKASLLWEMAAVHKTHKPLPNERQRQLIIL